MHLSIDYYFEIILCLIRVLHHFISDLVSEVTSYMSTYLFGQDYSSTCEYIALLLEIWRKNKYAARNTWRVRPPILKVKLLLILKCVHQGDMKGNQEKKSGFYSRPKNKKENVN